MKNTIGQPLTIPELKGLLSQTRISVGALGEQLVARALETTGYQVLDAHKQGDLTVADSNGQLLFVEVKTSRRGRDGYYRFTLYKQWQGRQCTNHEYADFVVLLAVLRTGEAVPFVIPTSDLKGRKSLTISSYPWTYAGWIAQYRQTIKKLRLQQRHD